MPTSAQIYNALTIENTFDVLNASAPINFTNWSDITNWASLNIIAGNGDTVKIIAQVLNPVQQGCYENAGYATDSFASPDTTLADLDAPQFNLLVYTGTTTPVYGTYSFNLKVQVTPNGEDAIVVEKTFLVELSENIAPTLTLQETYNCGNATYTSLDTTNYGVSGYSLLTNVRIHKVEPPQAAQAAGQSPVTGDAQTILLGAPDNQLWTGTYAAFLTVTLTYKQGNYYTIVHATTNTEKTVECDNGYCNLVCCLNTLIDKYQSLKGINPVEANMYLKKWQLGVNWLVSILNQCNNPTKVAAYTTQFYLDTGCDPNCDCGCTDEPAPVIPTDIINGTDGTDGLTAEFRVTGTLFQWKYTTGVSWTTLIDFSTIAGLDGTSFLQGSGAPSNGDGNNGDTYLDVDTGNIYLKTAGTWNLTGNIKGESGTQIIVDEFPNTSTASNVGYETLATETLTAGLIATNESELQIHAVFETATSEGGLAAQGCKIVIGGTDLNVSAFWSNNIEAIEVNVRCVRTGATTLRCIQDVVFWSGYGTALSSTLQNPSRILEDVTVTLSNAVTILAQGVALSGTAVTLKAWRIAYLPKV